MGNIVFETLGIEKTRDEALIRSAYYEKLAVTNPEDKPEEFMLLRKAYEEALNYAKYGEDNADDAENVDDNGEDNRDEALPENGEGSLIDEDETEEARREREAKEEKRAWERYVDSLSEPVVQWIRKVEQVYTSIKRRIDVEEWKTLLADEVCTDLEYSQEAQQCLLHYCADHFQLSCEVYRLFDETFSIEENQEECKEYLPVGFVDHIINKIHDEEGNSDFAWEWLEGEDGADFDGFIQWNRVLEQQIFEQDVVGATDTLIQMEKLNIYHPFMEVEKIRLDVQREHTDNAVDKIENLIERYPDSLRIPLLGAEVIWKCGDHERAVELFRMVLDKIDNYLAEQYMAYYENEQGNYREARKYAEKSLRKHHDEELSELLKTLNEKLLNDYESEQPQTIEEAESFVEACLHSEESQKGIAFLTSSSLLDEMPDGYGYLAELYLMAEEWDKAIEATVVWHGKLEQHEQPEEVRRKKSGAFICLAKAAQGKAKKLEGEEKDVRLTEAADNVRKSLEFENGEFWMNHRVYLLDILMEKEDYEGAKEAVDNILEVYPNIYYFIEKKQKICYELREAQEVVDLFYQAKDIYYNIKEKEDFQEETVNLYERTAEVFWHYSQHSDVENILRQAEEEGIMSSKLARLQAGISRQNMRRTGKPVHAKKALEDAGKVIENSGKETNEYLDRCIIYLDLKQYDKALEDAQKALELKENDCWAYHCMARAYYGMGDYKKTIEMERNAINELDSSEGIPEFFLTAGWACERMGEYAQAEKWYIAGVARCDEDGKSTIYNRWIGMAKNLKKYSQAEKLMDEAFELGLYGEQIWRFKKDKLLIACIRNHYRQSDVEKYIKGIEENAKAFEGDANRTKDLADAYLMYAENKQLAKETYIKAYTQAMESENQDYGRQTMSLVHLMELYQEEGDMEQVQKYGACFRQLLCMMYEEEDEEQAQKDFMEDVYDAKPNLYDMGVYWVRMGNLEKARECYEAMKNVQFCTACFSKGCTDCFELLAIIYEAEGKMDEAYKLYKKANEVDEFNPYAAWKFRSFHSESKVKKIFGKLIKR